jgi:hypothetical protein
MQATASTEAARKGAGVSAWALLLLLAPACPGRATWIGSPVTVAAPKHRDLDHVTALASDERNIYWLTYGTTDFFQRHREDGALWALPRSGGPAVMLASQLGAPSSLAVDGDRIYFTTSREGGGAVAMVPVRGGSPLILADKQVEPHGLALDASSLYWIAGPGERVMRLRRASPGTPGVGGAEVLTRGHAGLRDLVVTGDTLYFVASGQAWSITTAGGAPAQALPGFTPDRRHVASLTADDHAVYALSCLSAKCLLLTAPTSGGSPSALPSTFLPGTLRSYGAILITAPTTVEFGSAILGVPKQGGAPVLRIPERQTALHSDRQDLYWANPAGIRRMALPRS